MPKKDSDFVKIKVKETALLPFRQNNKNSQQSISKEELAALTNLSKNKDIVIQKFDKGNSLVIVDKETYIKKNGKSFKQSKKV